MNKTGWWYRFNRSYFSSWKRKFYELEKMWSELIPKEKLIIWLKKLLIIFFSYMLFLQGVNSSENEIYKKIDLFGEVLEKINKEYVDEISIRKYGLCN